MTHLPLRTPSLRTWLTLTALVLASSAVACGDDDNPGFNPSPAQRSGVGAACSVDADCLQTVAPLRCLSFKGGYCGLSNCMTNADCPLGSSCVAHDDGTNYCFLTCIDKPDCNLTRPVEVEANCSSSITFVDGKTEKKACVPPS
jgi:hypothetical protein